MDDMIPQSGPAEIAPSAPLIAPPVQLPPASSVAAPAAEPAEPAGPVEPDNPPSNPEPTFTPQPERPANAPDPQAQREHRDSETIAALLATNDEYAEAINALNRKVSQLGRNDLILAAALGVVLWQVGGLARKVFAAQIDAALDTAAEVAGEV